MSVIGQIADGRVDIAEVLRPEALIPYYDVNHVTEPRGVYADAEIRRKMKFVPIIADPKFPESPDRCISMHRKNYGEAQHMGMLISESRIFMGLFVVNFYPHPQEAEYPTRILSLFGKRIVHDPIVGFLAKRGRVTHYPEAGLLTKKDDEKVGVERLGVRNFNFDVARVILGRCKKVKQRYVF